MTPLFDAYAGFGGREAQGRAAVSAEQWSGEMERISIDRSLVRIAPDELDTDFASSNKALLKACQDSEALVPCPVVVPNTAYDTVPEEQQVESILARGAGAACVRPRRDHWILSDWVCGRLFEALQSHRVPIFCLEKDVPLEKVAELASRYPELPVIVAEAGYRSQRVLLPLLATFGNVYLCLGGALSVHRGIEQLVAKAGAERLLFGTGFPEAEPMAAVTQLMYAEISDRQRRLIGSGNLERLVGGIRR
jgi:hypothetical protein